MRATGILPLTEADRQHVSFSRNTTLKASFMSS